ncbi:hypothetical protein AS194_11685 [Psychrobacter piscatorii]|uniref:Uncharacterized protein n=1 Tax=Psychrobacter piscatorii TaxID=554343 RepID=A0A0T6DNT5_9GAMM|nr:hypothetical protein AS194_11685 [Psychrobacter piscatorii]
MEQYAHARSKHQLQGTFANSTHAHKGLFRVHKKGSFRTGIEGGIVLSFERIDRGHRHHSHAQEKNRFKKKLKGISRQVT